MNEREQIIEILKEFWRQKDKAGAEHACVCPTDEVAKKLHPAHRTMTIEEAAKNILEVIK